MKRKIIKSIITIEIVISLFAFKCMAFNDLEAGAYLWKLINEARSRPIEAIKAYGIDYESAKRALGDDAWILELENGLPPLAWNRTLEDSSTAHNGDMINRQYYSYTSPEGLSFHDRIINSGYTPLLTGESLSILSFYLYVDPVKAVEGIFENMLRDELNPDLGYAKNIFSKDFTEIGVSFISTIFSLGKDSAGNDLTLNAYLVTADFAKPVETKIYIIGNIYNIGDNQPLQMEWNLENDYAAKLLNYKGWSPDKANNNFILWVHNFTQDWSIEILNGHLGTYQIEMPPNTFYSIDLYNKNPDSGTQGDFLKRIINIGLNVNKMVDFGIN
ncbi:MAG: hypothetical protein HQK70_00920 [Desulfamplus sp.]|nr:hypothetical protein [Desulfamplus sp.]